MKQWSEKDYFINPYNFVSIDLDGSEKETKIENEKRNLTGVLKCRLIVKTPIAVPDSEYMEDENGHKTYQFFHYQDNIPVIPGSTIRGAVRNVYETITDSCFSTAKADSVLTIRGKNPFSPGVLLRDEDGKWSLYKAERHKIRVVTHYQKNRGKKTDHTRAELVKIGYGTKVFFPNLPNGCVEEYATEEKWEERREGYLYVGEQIAGKRYEGIFEICKKEGKAIKVEAENIEKLIEQLEKTIYMYRNISINKNMEKTAHSGYQGYEKAKERGAVPVWYCDKTDNEEQELYLSMACIGRYVYSDMGHVIKNKIPCMKRNELCKACALFGMASSEKMGSRVRFTDAKAIDWNEEKLEKKVTLRELASPHSSYFPFYRKKPISQNEEKKDISHSDIRGRKHYWHTKSDYYKKAEDNEKHIEIAKTQRNATMDLVTENVEFVFYVYYDRVTEKQLEELLWTLTLGDNDKNSRYCYKLGHGKPIGLGSVKILVDEKMECSYKDEYEVKADWKIDILNPFKESSRYNELMKILDFAALQEQISLDVIKKQEIKCVVEYPRVIPGKNMKNKLKKEGKGTIDDKDFAGYQWFGENYKLGEKAKEPEFYLPEILDDKLFLPSLEIESDGQNRQNEKQEQKKEPEKKVNNHYKQKNEQKNKQYGNKNSESNAPMQILGDLLKNLKIEYEQE